MHIPDGFLSPPVWGAAWALSVGGLGLAIKATNASLKEKTVPLMGVMSAFVFAAQMINFPVAGGTSGHLLGGVLAAVLLGPFPGAIVLSVVLIAQCLLFQDGGITALGANIFNMAFIGTLGGYLAYKVIRSLIKGNAGLMAGVAIASWLSVVVTSGACALELALSGTSPLRVVLPTMLIVHAIIGIGEAIITGAVVSFVLKARPDLVHGYTEVNA